MRWLIDGMNVIGTRPDAWWRDRRARDGPPRLSCSRRWAAANGEDVTSSSSSRPVPPIRSTVIEVAHAPRPRRDSADDEIVRLLMAEARPGRREGRHLRPLARRPRARRRRERPGRRLVSDRARDALMTPLTRYARQRRRQHRLSGGRRRTDRHAVPARLDLPDRAALGGAGQPALPRANRRRSAA